MSRFSIKPDQALPLLKEVAGARKRWGRQTSPPYSVEQIMEALEIVSEQGVLDPYAGPSKEEVTLLRRQLAACQNREKARKAKDDGSTEETP